MIRAREIDLSQDLRFVRRSWTAERIGWGALGALLVAGLLGFLGPGLFSKRTADGPVRVEYDRFERVDSGSELRARLKHGARNLWVEKSWLKDVEVETLHPEPVRTSAQGEWVVYSFDGAGDIDVRLGLNYLSAGSVEGRFGAAPDKTVSIKQFVLP
jgi:hypothetical protein